MVAIVKTYFSEKLYWYAFISIFHRNIAQGLVGNGLVLSQPMKAINHKPINGADD